MTGELKDKTGRILPPDAFDNDVPPGAAAKANPSSKAFDKALGERIAAQKAKRRGKQK